MLIKLLESAYTDLRYSFGDEKKKLSPRISVPAFSGIERLVVTPLSQRVSLQELAMATTPSSGSSSALAPSSPTFIAGGIDGMWIGGISFSDLLNPIGCCG